MRSLSLMVALVLGAASAPGGEFKVTQLAPGLYHGKAPRHAADFDHLQRLGIRTVVDLRSYRPVLMNREERELTARGICYKNVPFTFRPDLDDSPERAYAAMTRVVDAPLYIHCQLDRDRTSILVGFYRVRVQGWSVEAAAREIEEAGLKDWLGRLWPYFYAHAACPR